MIDRLLDPQSIAIVGVSADRTKHGTRVLENLRKLGFPGPLWGVNPRRPAIAGIDVYTSLHDLPAPPDMVVCAVPAAAAPGVLRQAAGSGVAVVFAGGFGETGDTGSRLEADLAAAAAAAGVRVLGPNSGGVIVPGRRLAASFLTCLDRPADQIRPGPVALVTQSGGTGSYLHNQAAARGSGFAASVSTGNELDLNLADAIDAVTRLDGVHVIALVVESVRAGPALVDAVRSAVAADIRVVALRIGTTTRSAPMVESHTGALATPARVFEGAARSLGVTLVETPDELLDVAEILARAPRSSGASAGVVTHSGGIAILLADLAERHRLQLPPPLPALEARLKPLLEHGSASNPLDMGGIMGGPGRFAATVAEFARQYDSVLAVTTAHPPAHTLERAQSLIDLGTPKPVVHLWMGGDVSEAGLALLRAAGLPVTEEPRAAIAALAALAALAEPRPEPPPAAGPTLDLDGAPFNEWAVKRLLEGAGFPVVPGHLAQSAAQAIAAASQIGYPVALKVAAPGLAHKSELDLVELNVHGPEAVATAFDRLIRTAAATLGPFDGVLVEEMAPGPEAIIGVTQDDTFGPMVAVGVGGIAAEALQDVALALAPVPVGVARRMIDALAAVRVFTRPRRGEAADLDALARLVVRAGQLASTHSDLELDLNPVTWSGGRWRVVDAYLQT